MNKIKALLIAGLLSLSSVSFATTFDFAGYASSLGEQGFDTVTGFSATEGAVTVTATGTDANGAAHAYLDGPFNGNEGGLGVCSTLDLSKQCNPSSDDNVTAGEAVKLQFSQKVKIADLTLADGVHLADFGGKFEINVDNGNQVLTNIMLETNPAVALGLVGSTFEFINLGGDATFDFYINSIGVSTVPVPAAGILFASALLGAGAFGRRKKKAKASVVGAFARAS